MITDDMKWVYERAPESQQFNIPGVTYMVTMGVVSAGLFMCVRTFND
jgi:hypothetical protein